MAKKETYLTKEELAEFRELLLQKRRALMQNLHGLQEELAEENGGQSPGGELSNLPTHPADMGTDEYQQQISLQLLEGERNRIQEIDEALRRMEDGKYGICMGTGEPISKKRLRAKPWARYSLEYARQHAER